MEVELMKIIETIKNIYSSGNISTTIIVSTLIVSLILGSLECLLYRFVSKRYIHNKSLLIAIVTIPCFVSTIILCLQSNAVITLGTIGALAIIRFRTAIKEPVDMVYLLWSIHVGIMAGCQLYEIAVITSLVVSVILLSFSLYRAYSRQITIIVKTNVLLDDEAILKLLKENVKSYRIEARNYSNSSHDYIFSVRTNCIDKIEQKLSSENMIEKYSILETDGEE